MAIFAAQRRGGARVGTRGAVASNASSYWSTFSWKMLDIIKFRRVGVGRDELDAVVDVLEEDRESGGVPMNASEMNNGAELSTPEASGCEGG